MMSFLIHRPIGLTIGLSSSVAAIFLLTQPRLRCDSFLTAPFGHDHDPNSRSAYASASRTPSTNLNLKRKNGLNASTAQQIARGSITGLICGIAVSAFSRPLSILIGLLAMGISFIESRGIHIIPYHRLQGYFTSFDITSALEKNLALKGSFGITFALAAFAQF